MSPFTLLSLVVVTLGTGCMFKDKVSTESPKSTAQECKRDITQFYDARMPCIIDGKGNSTHVGEVFTFQCAPFKVGGGFVSGSDPFAISTPICLAAAYVGKLDPAAGGPVKIEILAKMTDFPEGEVKNGVKSQRGNSTNGMHGYRVVD